VILAAQFKAGKTTLVGNLTRSLLDGDLWLGKYPVTPLDGSVALLDFEMSGPQLTDWLRDQGIKNSNKVVLVPMRGRAPAFDLLTEDVRARWASLLKSKRVGYLILDCLRPIMDGLGLDEHHDAGRFLVALDELLREAAIPDCLVVHHMGHTPTSGRVATRGSVIGRMSSGAWCARTTSLPLLVSSRLTDAM
jgi:RecA-family ATPase